MQFLSLSHQSNQQERTNTYNGKRIVISFPKGNGKSLKVIFLAPEKKNHFCASTIAASGKKRDIFTVPLQHWVRVHRV